MRSTPDCEAITLTGRSYLLKDGKCNHCMLDRIRKLYGSGLTRIVEASGGGVNVMVSGRYLVWMPEEPERCTCNPDWSD